MGEIIFKTVPIQLLFIYLFIFSREREIKGEERKTEEKANNHS